MKKWFVLTAAAVMFAAFGCDPEPTDPTKKTEDSVSVAPESKDFDKDGGKVSVMVTSSGEWTVKGKETYNWISVSANKGLDGDIIRFTVNANDTEEVKNAEYIFTVGEKTTASFKIKLAGKDAIPPVKLDVVGDKELLVDKAKGRIEIKLDTEINYRELEQNIVFTDGEGWLTYASTLEGAAENEVLMYFDVAANAGFANRSAKVTIFNDKASVEVTVTQKQVDKLNIDKSAEFVYYEGGTLNVTVDANVPYAVVIPVDATAWISQTGPVAGVHTFTIAPGTEVRSATVNFVSQDELISKPLLITQKKNALINMAASMFTTASASSGNRAWPVWKNPAPVTNMEEITMEALVYADTWKTTGKLNTVMGIENRFLIRTGDVGKPNNMVEITSMTQYGTSNTSMQEKKITVSAVADLLPAGKWNHIAVTYSVANQEMKCYINGVLKGSVKPGTGYFYRPVNIGIEHSEETNITQTFDHKRCFWVGYAYEQARFWPGMMSEVRIWNKVLTEAEIQAENHFYSVPVDSDGLVAYWKFNDGTPGTTDVVKDYTSYGNHLNSQGTIDWKVVTVPAE